AGALPGIGTPASSATPASGGGDQAPAAPAAKNNGANVQTNQSGLPTEVIIKGEQGDNKLGNLKPPLHIEADPFESIRPSLQPDQSLLLAVSPLTVSWRRTHPETLYNQRVVQPWRTTFSQKAGIVFRVRDELGEVLQRKVDDKEARSYAWSLTIADEEGRVFQHWEGSSDP